MKVYCVFSYSDLWCIFSTEEQAEMWVTAQDPKFKFQVYERTVHESCFDVEDA